MSTLIGNAATHSKTRNRLRKRLRSEGWSEAQIEEAVTELAERQREWRARSEARNEETPGYAHDPPNRPLVPPKKRRRWKTRPEGGPARSSVSQIKRETVIALNGPLCAYCGRNMADRDTPPGFTIDHVIPLARGGTNAIVNLVACCRPCNSRKSNKLLSELGWGIRPDALARRRELDMPLPNAPRP